MATSEADLSTSRSPSSTTSNPVAALISCESSPTTSLHASAATSTLLGASLSLPFLTLALATSFTQVGNFSSFNASSASMHQSTNCNVASLTSLSTQLHTPLPCPISLHSSSIITLSSPLSHNHIDHALENEDNDEEEGDATEDSDYLPDSHAMPSCTILDPYDSSNLILTILFSDPDTIPLLPHRPLFSADQLALFGLQQLPSLHIPDVANHNLCSSYLLGTHTPRITLQHLISLLGTPHPTTISARIKRFFPNLSDHFLTTHCLQALSPDHPSYSRHSSLHKFLQYFILLKELPASPRCHDPSRSLATRSSKEAFYAFTTDKPYPTARLLLTSLSSRISRCARRVRTTPTPTLKFTLPSARFISCILQHTLSSPVVSSSPATPSATRRQRVRARVVRDPPDQRPTTRRRRARLDTTSTTTTSVVFSTFSVPVATSSIFSSWHTPPSVALPLSSSPTCTIPSFNLNIPLPSSPSPPSLATSLSLPGPPSASMPSLSSVVIGAISSSPTTTVLLSTVAPLTGIASSHRSGDTIHLSQHSSQSASASHDSIEVAYSQFTGDPPDPSRDPREMIERVMLPDAHRAHRLIHRLADASQEIQMLTHHLVAYFLHLTDGRLLAFDEMREEHLRTITCLESRIATLYTQLDTQRAYYSDMLRDITLQRDSLNHALQTEQRAHEDTSSRLQAAQSRIISLEAAQAEDEEQQFEAFRTYLASRRQATLHQHPTSSSAPTSSTG